MRCPTLASASALKVAALFKRFLKRDEWLHIEEMVINYYPVHVINHLKLMEKRKRLTLDTAYYEVMNGQLRNSSRMKGNRRITGGLAVLYDTFEKILPLGFRDSELDAIMDIYEDCSQGEIERALNYTLARGIKSARYCYKLIISLRERNRRVGQALKEIDHVDAVCRVHDVDHSVDAWRDRLLSSQVKRANARTK